jgi:long-chain acyl-CoA synthetase
MLYDLWRATVQSRRRELALTDAASGRVWTFEQLAAAAETEPVPDSWLAYPRGMSPEFLIQVLAAWRGGRVVCPLEPGQAPPEIPIPAVGSAHLKTTSASTGRARVVAFTSGQLAADARNIVQTMGLRPEWPNLGVISLAHSYGFSNLALPLFLHGIPLVLVPSPLPEVVRRAITGASNITVAGVPALWRTWHDAGILDVRIRLAISAGAPLPLALENDVFASVGIKIHNFYGASECGGIAYDASSTPRTDAALAGQAMKNVRLTRAEDGCLEIRGDAVGLSYWPDPDECLRSGCFRAPDLVELGPDGVRLCGRISDLINIAGRKVAPEVIERELLKHPGVRECLVFGIPSEAGDRGEEPVAVVSAKSEIPVESFKKFLLERLPAWQVPREWWIVDRLETNLRGKLSRMEWRQRYLEEANRVA